MTAREIHNPESASEGVEDEVSFLDLAQTIAANLRLLVFGPIIVGLLALGISFLIAPIFTATTVIMPPQQQQGGAAALLASLGALGGAAGSAVGVKNPNDQFVSMIASRTVADSLIKRFKLAERYDAEFVQDAREELESRTKVSSGKDGLISISVDDEQPAFAAELANAYVEELSEMLGRLAVTEAQQRRAFFESQLLDAKDKLIKAERALQVTGVDVSALKANPSTAVSTLAQLQANITAQEVKVASMRGYLADGAPEFKQAMTQLSALRTQLERAEQKTSSAVVSENDYISKFRDFKYHETLFELFSRQYEVARVDEAKESNVMQVVDVAIAPEKKSKPKKAIIAVLTTLATGFMLLLFVFVRQAYRTASRDSESASKIAEIARLLRRALRMA